MTLLWIVVVVLAALFALGALVCLVVMFSFKPPTGQTLQERYPAAPGAFVTSYSSIDLPEEAFVKEPRRYPPTVTLTRTTHLLVVEAEATPLVARIWEGTTASGIRFHAYVAQVKVVDQADAAAFERELTERG